MEDNQILSCRDLSLSQDFHQKRATKMRILIPHATGSPTYLDEFDQLADNVTRIESDRYVPENISRYTDETNTKI